MPPQTSQGDPYPGRTPDTSADYWAQVATKPAPAPATPPAAAATPASPDTGAAYWSKVQSDFKAATDKSPAETGPKSRWSSILEGFIPADKIERVTAFGQLDRWKQHVTDLQNDIRDISSRPITPQYSADQRSRDMEKKVSELRDYAGTIASNKTFSRIVSGISSPAGLGLFVTSLFGAPGRFLASAAGGGMAASDIGSKREGETDADWLERNLLALSGVTLAGAGIRESAPKAVSSARGAVRATAQEIAGAGKEPIAGEVRERGGAVRERQEAHVKDVEEAAQKDAQAQQAHEQKVAKLRKDWVEKAREARKAEAGKAADKIPVESEAAKESKLKALDRAREEYTEKAKSNVAQTLDKVDAAFDQRWRALDDAVGTDTAGNSAEIVEAVKSARNKLGGIPANLTEFDNVLNAVAEKPKPGAGGAVVDQPELIPEAGAVPETTELVPKDVAWSRLRKQFTQLSRKAHSMPVGTPRSALLDVVKAYDDVLTKMADNAGKGKEYAGLKSDWSEYMDDWHKRSASPAKTRRTGEQAVSSPLAELARTVDNKTIAQELTGAAGDRLLTTYAKYVEYGADPALLAKIRDTIREGRKIVVEKKSGLETRTYPGAGESQGIRVPPRPETPPPPAATVVPPAEPVPDVNAFDTRLRRLESFSSARLGLWDLAPWRLLDKALLKFPKIKAWVASYARPGDPDFVPPAQRQPMTSGQIREAVAAYEQFGDGMKSAIKDYGRGSITRQGLMQRILAVAPNMSKAEALELVGGIDRMRGAVISSNHLQQARQELGAGASVTAVAERARQLQRQSGQ